MLPFALGAVVGAIAVTAIAESKLGKKVSKEGAKLIDNLDDRISRLARQVNEDNELVEKLKGGYDAISSKVNELTKYCQEKGKDFANAVKEKVAEQEAKPAKKKIGRPAGAKNKEKDPEIASMVKKLKEAKGKEGEAKPKPKKRAFVLTPEEKRARKAKQARLYYAKNREKILAQNKERQAGKAKKTYPSRQKRIDKIKNIEIK
jgi:hypothetical protein